MAFPQDDEVSIESSGPFTEYFTITDTKINSKSIMFQETIDAYTQNRVTSAPLLPGPNVYTSSDHFRLKSTVSKPVAKDWSHQYSIEGSGPIGLTLKTPSSLAGVSIPTISLAIGRPASELCPWENLTIDAQQPSPTSIDDGPNLVSKSCSRGDDAYDLAVAMNYGYAAGSPQLLRFITEHVEMIHKPRYQDWETCLTCGTTSAIDIVFRLLCDRGDSLVVEEYSYPGALEAAKRMGLKILDISMDEQGLLPDDLDRKLSQWDGSGRKPSVMYTIPSGQNPTGATQSLERRRAIYEVAERHDLLIVEDDPYYFIQLEVSSIIAAGSHTSATRSDAYLQGLPPSYLSLDTSGRVLRLDSTSKSLAPGLRCGWITAPSQSIAKFVAVSEVTTGAPSGPSQVMMHKLLDEAWGHAGLIDWLIDLSLRYEHRLAILLSACEKYLPTGICKWSVPRSGLFLWIQIDWSLHPTFQANEIDGHLKLGNILDIEGGIYQLSRSYGVQITRGSWFASGQPSSSKMFLRLTFAAAPKDDLTVAVERFGKAIREEFSKGV